MKKYEIIESDTKILDGVTLYRIRALRDIPEHSVKAGDLGGYVQSERNLSHKGNAWVGRQASVFGNAVAINDALVTGKARVWGSAFISHQAIVGGKATVYGEATVMDNAFVFENACVCDRAKVKDTSRVFGHSILRGNVTVFGEAQVYGIPILEFGFFTGDIVENKVGCIASSLNTFPVNGKYLMFKWVEKIADGIYRSKFDPSFIYKDNEVIEVPLTEDDYNPLKGKGGIYVSMAYRMPFYGDTLIAVEVELEDILSCMSGEIRAKKVRVIGEVAKHPLKEKMEV